VKLSAARRRQPVSLFFARRIFLLETLNPLFFKQPPKRSIEGSRTHSGASLTQRLNVFQERIPVARAFRQTQQDQEYRFRQWFYRGRSLHNMSPTDILDLDHADVNQIGYHESGSRSA
jgi:hypothetical protein